MGRDPARGWGWGLLNSSLFLLSFKICAVETSHLSALNIPGGGSRKKKGEDVVHTLRVSLKDLYNGTTKKFSLSRNILCPKCKGYLSFFNYLTFFIYYCSVALCDNDFQINVLNDDIVFKILLFPLRL